MIVEGLKGYVFTVMAAGIVLAFGDLLLPEGNIKKHGRMALSICLMTIVLSPLLQLMEVCISTGGMLDLEGAQRVGLAAIYDEYGDNLSKITLEKLEAKVKFEIGESGAIEEATVYSYADREGLSTFLSEELGAKNIVWRE